MKFTLKSKQQGSQDTDSTEICVRILKVSDEKVAVEFQKLSGNQPTFHTHFNDIKKNCLNFANDTNLEE